MPCGLYGKLPVKRDFIAVNTPRDFLMAWEAWMQGGMSAGKLRLGTEWLPRYLSAPLWRFWIGADVTGTSVVGVLMPSVDGVGRHFPLTLFACGEAGDSFVSPADPVLSAWFENAEDFLLGVLDPEIDYDAMLGRLNLFAMPPREPAAAVDADITQVLRADVLRSSDLDTLPDSFGRLEREDRRRQMLRRSYFWTIGGEAFAPASMMSEGLPDPYLFGAMLSGEFRQNHT